MLIYLLRHGQTEYNAQKRYQGQRDIPLSPEGAAQLRRADFDPDVVYVSTLQRTSQTARILFPEAKLVPVDGLKEMCFGSFEGRNFIEMEKDPEYQAWVKANCESPCPDGERKTDFSDRICRTVAELIDKALAAGEERLVILAHGGTQMAAMERFAVPHRDYYAWCGPNAGGFVLDAKDWTEKHLLYLVKTVQYTKESKARSFRQLSAALCWTRSSATRRGCRTRWCLWADASPGWKSSCAPACPAPRRASCWAVP